MNVQEITITKQPYIKGGSQIEWNVELDGRPFGQITAFRRQAGYRFKFLAKALMGNGETLIPMLKLKSL